MSGSVDGFDAFSSGGPFPGFSDEDFQAYEKKKWSSNAYTLERRRAKDKLLALVRQLTDELGGDLGDRELHGSDEAPTVKNGKKVAAQWAFFVRPAKDRNRIKPINESTDLMSSTLFDIALEHQHACLTFRLDVDGLAIGYELAGLAKVDRQNVSAKLGDPAEAGRLIELVRALPEGTVFGFGESSVNKDALEPGQVADWAQQLPTSDARLFVEVLTPPEDQTLRSSVFVEQAKSRFAAFLPIDAFLTWSGDNDAANLNAELQKSEAEQIKATEGRFKKGDRVTILAGFFAGQGGFILEIQKGGKAKVGVGPASIDVNLKDLKLA